MANLKRYARLASFAAMGVVAMVLATFALVALRDLLEAQGHTVSPLVSIIVFFVVVGDLYSAFAKLALREARKLGKASDSTANS